MVSGPCNEVPLKHKGTSTLIVLKVDNHYAKLTSHTRDVRNRNSEAITYIYINHTDKRQTEPGSYSNSNFKFRMHPLARIHILPFLCAGLIVGVPPLCGVPVIHLVIDFLFPQTNYN